MMNIWWSPGQSDAAKHICSQLNWREKASIVTLSLLFVLCWFVFMMLIMGSGLGIGPLKVSFAGFAFPLAVFLVACAVAAIVLQRRVLLSTQVARDNDYTMADINDRQPPSRSDYLKLSGIAALAVAISLVGILVSFLMAA